MAMHRVGNFNSAGPREFKPLKKKKELSLANVFALKIKTTITKRPVRLITLEQRGISKM